MKATALIPLCGGFFGVGMAVGVWLHIDPWAQIVGAGVLLLWGAAEHMRGGAAC